jgi:hypothetical protein
MADATSILEDRPLRPQERALVGWLLEHGNPDAAGFLTQLAQARVVSRCPCGCASIDFSVGGAIPPSGAGMRILSDYVWRADDGAHCGVFVFACGGLLAGLEVWTADGMGPVSSLPATEWLRPLAAARSAEPSAAADPARDVASPDS